jgi:prophage tail gpP-like protein
VTLSLTHLPDIVVTGTKIPRDRDEVYINVNDQQLGGWEEVEITLRLEGFPNSFTIAASGIAPVDGKLVPIEGNDCTILIGTDKVITGYVDRSNESGSGSSHGVSIQGRGKTQDLVDCSAEWPTGQIFKGTALYIAQQLVLPYKSIAVEMGPGASPGPEASGWSLNYGETAAEIIQKFARNAGLLAYEDSSGKLILAKVGDKKAASGIVYGVNVEAWSCENSMDGRYSDLVCQSFATLNAIDELKGPGNTYFFATQDKEVPRHRLLYVVAEPVAADVTEFNKTKALWDMARRSGRSHVVHATVDSWRDKDGKLWAPNTIVPVDLPGNRAGPELILSEVTFRRTNGSGTTADMLLMPREAFVPEPFVVAQVNAADVKGASSQ